MTSFLKKYSYPLFAVVLFLSSFLLFLVQPLLSKHLLPWFGGSAAVWVTAVSFFITTLFLGYLYALWLSRLRPLLQTAVHVSLVVTASALILVHGVLWPSPITSTVAAFPVGEWSPSILVLWILLVSIGLPFLVLSSTSSLVQQWYHRVSEREPYSLYAISNLGSLLGLLSYVFFVEPYASTVTQGFYWAIGFGVVAMGLTGVGALFAYSTWREGKAREVPMQLTGISWRTYGVWVGLSALPVLVLLSGTDYMTSLIAPIPLFWVLPLVLYLLSFTYAFRSNREAPRSFHYMLAGFFVSISTILIMSNYILAPVLLVLLLMVMAVVFTCSHLLLYAKRPHGRQSSEFYVATSLGGVIASVFAILIELYLLPVEIELFVYLLLFGFGAVYYSFVMPDAIKVLQSIVVRRAFLQMICILPVLLLGLHVYGLTENSLQLTRNFFGAKSVIENETDEYVVRHLLHGGTRHGTQYLTGEFANKPASYYTRDSGVGRAFAVLHGRLVGTEDETIDVGIIGLGTGALSVYCRPGDRFVFWEIDPEVVALAKQYFTFLSLCENTDVRIEDGRLGIERELERNNGTGMYDLLVVDAYADDVVPVHLLTKEAFASYLAALRDGGLLAVHISSRYLDLVPVLRALTREYSLHMYHVRDPGLPEHALPSQWVVFAPMTLSPDELSLLPEESLSGDGTEVLWTDTFSSLVPVVRWGI